MPAKRFLAAPVLLVLGMLSLAGCPAQPGPVDSDDPAAVAGQAKFNQSCAGCHSAASLRDDQSRVVNNLGAISSAMAGITLTDEEVANIRAFLAAQ